MGRKTWIFLILTCILLVSCTSKVDNASQNNANGVSGSTDNSGSGNDVDTKQLTDEKLQSKIKETNAAIKYYSAKIKSELYVNTEFKGELLTMIDYSDTSLDVDSVSRQMHIFSTINSIRGESSDEKQTLIVEQFILGNYSYTSVNGKWRKMAVNEKVRDQQDFVKRQNKIMANAKFEKIADETEGAKEYYVMNVAPNDEQFSEISPSQSLASSNISKIKSAIKEFSLRLWINKKTLFIEKTKMDLKLDYIDDNNPNDVKHVRTVYKVDTTIESINQPPAIFPPADIASLAK